MELKLAIVLNCDDTGCQVALVEDNSTCDAVYSSLVKNRIKIKQDQLVALNTSVKPVQIVWRWLRAEVIELGENTVVVDDMEGHPGKVSQVLELPIKLSLDEEVWVCSTGNAYEVHDIILDGRPVNPNSMLKYITPIIDGIYQR